MSDSETIPYGYCHCGCGEKTQLTPQTNQSRGWVKDRPFRFVHGHNGRRPVEERFWAKVDKGGPGDCWLWTGAQNSDGYGRFARKTKELTPSHRWSYENSKGPIPRGFHIDHLCRNPACVNPEHLEAVTQAENIRRGIGPSAKNARKTHCPRGHDFTVSAEGSRICRVCRREAARRRKKLKEEAPSA